MLHEPFPPLRLQRTSGSAGVALERRRGGTRLAALRQQGSAKAFLPSVRSPEPEVVFLNTAGGLTGGDRLAYSLDLGEGAQAVGTTQTAERAYASAAGAASVDVTLRLGPGARLDWLPQETILFDAAALERQTHVSLEGDAALVFAETVILGRAAMGERVERLAFRDTRLVRRDGRAVLVEPLFIDDAALARSGGAALLGGARALATVALVAPGAEAAAEAARHVPAEDVSAAASGWNGKCVVRALGADGWPLRRYLARLLAVLRGRPLPRVWQV